MGARPVRRGVTRPDPALAAPDVAAPITGGDRGRGTEPTAGPDGPAADRPDLRFAALGVAAWLGVLAAKATLAGVRWWLVPVAVLVTVVLAGVGVWAVRGTRVSPGSRREPRAERTLLGRTGATVAGLLLVVAAGAASTVIQHEAVVAGPLAEAAQQRAMAEFEATIVSDPRVIEGSFGDRVLVRLRVQRLRVERIGAAAVEVSLSSPMLLIADPEAWREVEVGGTVRARGRLAPAQDDTVAAVAIGSGPPHTLADPDLWWRTAASLRRSIRDAVQHRPDLERALVPALVDGDDAGLPEATVAEFKVAGLTHLTAVSGTNLTLVLGFALTAATWCGVRGRWLILVGAVGVAGFVLLARTEPSVLRAAVMGTVGLLAMHANGSGRAMRGLGIATVVLLLVSPGLATSAGFALSVLATAGIVLLAPGWRDALGRWLPRWLAEAIAVPAAAQLACTPLVAAISGQVSLVAVAANLLVAPVVGPATVLGLGGGLLTWIGHGASDLSAGVPSQLPADALTAAGSLLGTGAGWCVAWIIVVAHRAAALPHAAITWAPNAIALAALVGLCLLIVLIAGPVLRRPGCTLFLVGVAILALFRWPAAALPSDRWVAAMCDVGQGDALVLRAGPRQAVLIDAGPDPAAVDRCLTRLDVDEVPLVVLTHFHADHIDGLPGVLQGRRVGSVLTTGVRDPVEGADQVQHELASGDLGARVASAGQEWQVGAVALRVLWPPADGPGLEGPNDASVVLLARVGEVSLLLTGDVEPDAQQRLARLPAVQGLDVDVLKLPHHGSRYQDLTWLESLDAEAVLVSVGAENDYGHPNPEVLQDLVRHGSAVYRTDLDGDVLVLPDPHGIRVLPAGPG